MGPSFDFDPQDFDLSFAGACDSYARRKAEWLSKNEKDGTMPPSGQQLIAEALNQMSLEERGKAQTEVHGIAFDNNEEVLAAKDSETFRENSLNDMEQEVQRLKAASAWNLRLAAIELAEQQDEVFVKDPAFRMKFLRSDYWDARKAAARFVRFFDWKLELFGEAKLTKHISWDDLEPEDTKMLKKGHMQRLPERDRAGRAVYIAIYNGQTYHSPQSLVRTTRSSAAIDSMARIYLHLITTCL